MKEEGGSLYPAKHSVLTDIFVIKSTEINEMGLMKWCSPDWADRYTSIPTN